MATSIPSISNKQESPIYRFFKVVYIGFISVTILIIILVSYLSTISESPRYKPNPYDDSFRELERQRLYKVAVKPYNFYDSDPIAPPTPEEKVRYFNYTPWLNFFSAVWYSTLILFLFVSLINGTVRYIRTGKFKSGFVDTFIDYWEGYYLWGYESDSAKVQLAWVFRITTLFAIGLSVYGMVT